MQPTVVAEIDKRTDSATLTGDAYWRNFDDTYGKFAVVINVFNAFILAGFAGLEIGTYYYDWLGVLGFISAGMLGGAANYFVYHKTPLRYADYEKTERGREKKQNYNPWAILVVLLVAFLVPFTLINLLIVAMVPNLVGLISLTLSAALTLAILYVFTRHKISVDDYKRFLTELAALEWWPNDCRSDVCKLLKRFCLGYYSAFLKGVLAACLTGVICATYLSGAWSVIIPLALSAGAITYLYQSTKLVRHGNQFWTQKINAGRTRSEKIHNWITCIIHGLGQFAQIFNIGLLKAMGLMGEGISIWQITDPLALFGLACLAASAVIQALISTRFYGGREFLFQKPDEAGNTVSLSPAQSQKFCWKKAWGFIGALCKGAFSGYSVFNLVMWFSLGNVIGILAGLLVCIYFTRLQSKKIMLSAQYAGAEPADTTDVPSDPDSDDAALARNCCCAWFASSPSVAASVVRQPEVGGENRVAGGSATTPMTAGQLMTIKGLAFHPVISPAPASEKPCAAQEFTLRSPANQPSLPAVRVG